MGSFRIFCVAGGSPAERPGLNTGGLPGAGVLSDGDWLGMVCNSPCFWCCIVGNCGGYYTTSWPKKQVFIGRNGGFSREKAWSSIAATKKILSADFADFRRLFTAKRLGAGSLRSAATKGAALRVEFIAVGPTACYEGPCVRGIWSGWIGNSAGVLMRALVTDIKGLRDIAT